MEEDSELKKIQNSLREAKDSEFTKGSEPPITLSKWVLLSWIPVVLGVIEVVLTRLAPHHASYSYAGPNIGPQTSVLDRLLWIALPAILLGHLALTSTRTGWPPKSGAGLAFTGLVLGYFFGVLYLVEWLYMLDVESQSR